MVFGVLEKVRSYFASNDNRYPELPEKYVYKSVMPWDFAGRAPACRAEMTICRQKFESTIEWLKQNTQGDFAIAYTLSHTGIWVAVCNKRDAIKFRLTFDTKRPNEVAQTPLIWNVYENCEQIAWAQAIPRTHE